MRPTRGFRIAVAALLAAAVAQRVAYVLAQPAADPAFQQPALDARYYLEWARSLAAGRPGPQGAYYLAPLYAHFLAGWFRLFGEAAIGVCLLQQLMVLGAALLLGRLAARAAGGVAGVLSAGIVLLYQPPLYFAGRLVGESLALLLLAGALSCVARAGAPAIFGGGLLAGACALVRPNLLLVPVAWAAWEAGSARFRRAALVLTGVLVAVAPTAIRNFAVSGHPVPVSSNAGLTLYHGNGPGPLGIYNPPDGFSGSLASQREEATALARRLSGLALDDVDADRWWGRQALRDRLANPVESLRLLVRRLLLLVDSYEHGLDDPPMLDRNPWRLTLRLRFPGSPSGLAELPLLPFGLILGLASAGLALGGFRGSAGPHTWLAAFACAVTPIVFYVSSRYRLPFAFLLAVPAGVGASALFTRAAPGRARARAGALAAGCAALSFLVPFPELRRAEEAAALANRAIASRLAGDPAGAEREARRAVAADPESAPARFALALTLERSGRGAEAEAMYRTLLELEPGHAEAAGNLAGLLILRGEPAQAVPFLRGALHMRPGSRVCWTNLVVALAALGELPGARAAAREARRSGVALDSELLRRVGADGEPGAEGSAR